VQRADDRVRFHAWIQWLIAEQLADASRAGVRIVGDLPVGFHPGGFDAWQWKAVLARGATIGAPPDAFNASGQDWALPPFLPSSLADGELSPFAETLRAVLRHAGGIRLDHVMGLFRLWWVPEDMDPADGAYVRYPSDVLLGALAAEARRANAIVIGEDLGTVPGGVRRSLAARRILSTRLAYFERRLPRRYPRKAIAAVTTHDLPTMAGLWSGADLEDVERAGLTAHPEQIARLRRRLSRVGGVPGSATLEEVILAVHAALADSSSVLVTATLEDALRVAERPNLPGTTEAQRPNWSLALPSTLEALERDPFVAKLATALAR
jgi:4-alpha-glucanotransferase